MPDKSAIRSQAARLQALFLDAGATPVEASILQPADTLLDLYGEDIRARAFVTHDPLAGEQMLRPDFTVPVAQKHMASGAESARYVYVGEVFCRQETDTGPPSEYIQVGYEVFDRSDPATTDAEVFALITSALDGLKLDPVTGDIGILTAAVAGLRTTARRKAALMRHIWRPARFRALLDRFGARTPVPPARAALVADPAGMDTAPPRVGLRDITEVTDRIAALSADAAEPAISAEEMTLFDKLLALRAKSYRALEQMSALASEFRFLDTARARLDARFDALDGKGIGISDLEFDSSYGRTSMEYYDGFVFGFYASGRPDLPAIASGGRYDALTGRLGRGRAVPAVGGVIRPELIAEIGMVAQ